MYTEWGRIDSTGICSFTLQADLERGRKTSLKNLNAEKALDKLEAEVAALEEVLLARRFAAREYLTLPLAA